MKRVSETAPTPVQRFLICDRLSVGSDEQVDSKHDPNGRHGGCKPDRPANKLRLRLQSGRQMPAVSHVLPSGDGHGDGANQHHADSDDS